MSDTRILTPLKLLTPADTAQAGQARRFTPVEVLTEGLNQHCDELHPKQARSLLLLLEKHGYLVLHESTMVQPDDGQDIAAKWKDGKFEPLGPNDGQA